MASTTNFKQLKQTVKCVSPYLPPTGNSSATGGGTKNKPRSEILPDKGRAPRFCSGCPREDSADSREHFLHMVLFDQTTPSPLIVEQKVDQQKRDSWPRPRPVEALGAAAVFRPTQTN